MFGMTSCVIDESPCPFDPQPREHGVNLLGGGIVHVLGNAGHHDPRPYNDWLTRNLAGDALHVGAIGPIDGFHVILMGRKRIL